MPGSGSEVAPARLPLLAAASGGILYFLGYLGYGLWPCLPVFLTPLWWALEDGRARGPARAAAAGLAFGLAAYAGGFLWLWPLVDTFLAGNVPLGAVLWLAYGAWFALGFALYAALVGAMRARGRPLAVAGVAPLVALEWLQLQVFPLYAGAALAIAPRWIQTADLGGPLLLTALVAGANVVAFETFAWWRGRRALPRALWTGAVALALGALAYGQWRTVAIEAAIASAPALRIGVVQANLGVLDERALGLITHRRHLEETRALLAGGALDLIVWPESAYVRGLRRPLPLSGRTIRGDLEVPLLFGGSSVLEVDGRRRRYNSAFLIGADGAIHDVYDKNLLIPLAEQVPFLDLVPALGPWFPEVQEFRAARDVPALRLGPWRIATPICYEAIRPEFVRRMVVESRPHLLVTLANDAHFGDSQEPWIHLALARLRAVEHRRYLVRATNSGVSAIVDPMGRIVARTGVLERANLRGVVRPLDGTTLYARLGDWPGWLAAALVLLALAPVQRARSSSFSLTPPPPLLGEEQARALEFRPRARPRNGLGDQPPSRLAVPEAVRESLLPSCRGRARRGTPAASSRRRDGTSG